jgi:hypothetical protein
MKRLLTFALLLALSIPMLAERVDQQKAAKVAETVLKNKELTPVSMEPFNNLYLFNSENGFVMVAADDCARPVLAYSKDFSFKTENMPENVQGWMASLNGEIQQAVDYHLEATEETRREWELLLQGMMPEPKHRAAVEALVKTHWDQDEPYNNLCPGASMTGCVATTMAQIMKYWEWPYKGVGSHSYDHATYGQISVNFGNTTYDWDNMVEEVLYDSPEVQQTAVAKLMYHCGVSVDMDYSPESSAAFSEDVLAALYTYFDYNMSDIQWKVASDYGTEAWMALVKAELDGGRPMLYRGQSDEGGGHAFICDGYDMNDYLHFNWGWSGYCDGYYAFGALNPGAGGAGSGAGSYSDRNSAIIGIHPNTTPIAAPQNLSASVSDRTVSLHWTAVSGASRYKVYRDGFVINTNVSGVSYTDSDVIYGHHIYYVKAVNSNDICSLRSDEVPAAVTFPGPVVSDLRARTNDHNVTLSWTAPASESAQLKYGDGEAAPSSYGNPDGTGFCWGQRFTPEDLSPYAGMAITSVDLFSWKVTDYVLTIYRETEDEVEILISGIFSNPEAGWCRVGLPDPIPIDYESDLLVTFYNDCSEYLYMAAYTEDFEGGYNASLFMEDDYWYTMDNSISWLIRTNITDDTYIYSVYRDERLIASDITQTSYNDYNLPEGDYHYTVRTQYYGSLSDPSNIAQVVIGSSTDESDDSRMAVYPNPTNGKFIVRGEQMETIEVVSLTGQQLAAIKVDNDYAEVDLTEFHSGVYMLVVHTVDGARNVIRISKH